MGHGPAKFREADVTRAIKAARKAGLEVARIEIDGDGQIRVIVGTSEQQKAAGTMSGNPWDEVLHHEPH